MRYTKTMLVAILEILVVAVERLLSFLRTKYFRLLVYTSVEKRAQ